MVYGRVYLSNKLNSEFYELLDEYNILMDKWNLCNERIISLRLPRIFSIRTKKRILSIGREISELRNKFLKWDNRAKNFLDNPRFIFDPDQKNREITFFHFTNLLRHKVDGLNSDMILIAANYNNFYREFENRISFSIAIFAVFVSVIGLCFSLYGTFNNESLSIELKKLRIPEKINKIESDMVNLESMLVNLKEVDSLKCELKYIAETQNKILKEIKKQDDKRKNR